MGIEAHREGDLAPMWAATWMLSGFNKPWLFASGWAVDLHVGRVTRPHKDVDVAVFREDQLALQSYLRGWHLFIAADGRLRPWQGGEYIELPLHGIWAYGPYDEGPYTPERQPALEFLLNERTATHWVYRRDPKITLPLDRAARRTSDGLPYLAPEVVLLYKARSMREEDRRDWETLRGNLDEEAKEWLVRALRETGLGAEWLRELDGEAT